MAKQVKMEQEAEAAESQEQKQEGISIDQALQIVSEALDKGNRSGAFSLKEAQAITNVWESLIGIIKKGTEQGE